MDNESPLLLLVDDEPINLRVLRAALQDQRYKLRVATNGTDALKAARASHPNLILLDIQMADLDGYEVCQELQSDPATRDIAIIFLSALQSSEQRIRGLSLGAVDYITKPFEAAEVVLRVERQLQVQQERHRLLKENRELLLRELAESTPREDRESWVRGLVERGESDTLEFKSTLRWCLKKDEINRGVEIAWLKTLVAFLNSEGGTLIVGVDDDGGLVGIEKDGFANDDKYMLHVNNKIQQHIGLENASLIRYSLEPLDGGRVLVVECKRAKDPVFLSQGKDEAYYVRTGPGSRQLNIRQALAYVAERQNTASSEQKEKP
jgi:DNA-binding response OmpR family regulator